MAVKVLKMKTGDVPVVAEIHREAFPREGNSRVWVKSNFASYPKIICYVAVIDKTVAGFIFWTQKGGFRENVVLELEQIAVSSDFCGIGVGGKLISESLSEVEKYLACQKRKIKCVLVMTRKDNKAQALYKKVLGAKVETVVKNLYTSDEVIMVARLDRK